MLSRRTLLTFAVLPNLPPITRPRLLAGQVAAPSSDAVLTLPSDARFNCPPLRARLLGIFALRAGEVCAVAFACDGPQTQQDLLAFVGADGTLLALERLSWRGQGGAFSSRAAMLPDRAHLTLTRHFIASGKPPLGEAWTDYLRLEAGMLRDAPVRPVMAGTLQQALSDERRTIAGILKPGLHAVTQPLLTALRAPAFTYSALRQSVAGDAGQIR